MTDNPAKLSQLYTSSQVRKLLDISPSTLTRLVDRGIIEKVTPPGKKQGYYTRKSVQDYLEQQKRFIETYGEPEETTTSQEIQQGGRG